MFSVTCHLLFSRDLSPFAFWSPLPCPWCPSCSLPGSCVPRLWLGCGCLGPALRGASWKLAVLCASLGVQCAPCHWPCPRLSACLQACTRLVCSSLPTGPSSEVQRRKTNSPLEARELRLHPSLIVTPEPSETQPPAGS